MLVEILKLSGLLPKSLDNIVELCYYMHIVERGDTVTDTIVGFRINEEKVRQLQAQATREDRSLSSLIRRLIDKHLKEQAAKEANDVRK